MSAEENKELLSRDRGTQPYAFVKDEDFLDTIHGLAAEYKKVLDESQEIRACFKYEFDFRVRDDQQAMQVVVTFEKID